MKTLICPSCSRTTRIANTSTGEVTCAYCDIEMQLTFDQTPRADVPLDRRVMPDGHYWINDKQRYGWEVVRILGGNLWRFGIKEPCNLDKNKFEFIEVEAR